VQKIPDPLYSRSSPLGYVCAIGVGVALCVASVAALVGVFFPPANLAEFPPLEPRVTSDQRLFIDTPDHLERAFRRANFDLPSIRAGRADVPHLLLEKWPEGFETMKRADRKKALFIQTLLPLVMHVNKRIEAQRETLRRIIRRKRQGYLPTRREQAWMSRLAKLYRTDPEKIGTLLLRVAPIPPSLAIAQSATETGWGTSRFARKANALFGQWTYDRSEGLKPKDADPGTRHAIKRYDRLLGSTWDYVRNLNTNAAYGGLRRLRAKNVTDGVGLAGTLIKYSERGADYVTLLRRIIAQNRLAQLDKAKLQN
jgi:Bax protein